MTRAGQALRQQWAQEARRAAIMADPAQRAGYLQERADLAYVEHVLERYGSILLAATRRGELTAEDAVARHFAARERLAGRVRRMVTG